MSKSHKCRLIHQVFQDLTFSYGVLRLSELGNRLKQAREEKNISLDDLQNMTKIQKRYLLALEEGNYSIIPGKFYVRAFIKQYAEAVDINPDSIFEDFKNEVPSTSNDEIPEQLSRVKTHRELPKSASKFLDLFPKILTVVVIIAIAVGLWVWRQNAAENNTDATKESITDQSETEYTNNVENTPANDSQAAEEEPAVDENDSKNAEEVTPEEETPKQAITVKESSGSSTVYELTGTDKFELEVIAKSKSWVSIKNDKGKTFIGKVISEGESEVGDYTAESEITVRVGNIPGTDLKVNGELIKYEDAKSSPQNITIVFKKE